MSDAPRRSTALAYTLLAPSLFGVIAFLLLPILVVIWLSLYRWDLLGPLHYVGLANWRSVLHDGDFGDSLVVTAIFVALVVPAQTVLGLLAASMLARRLPGNGLFRTLYVLPWICAPLAIAVMWRWILAPTDGAVSTLLGRRIEWLTNPDLALPVVSAVVIWTNVGYVSLSLLAGLLAIPEDVHNAARTDGANAWQRFWRITLPLLRPVLVLVLVITVTGAFQVFDTVAVTTAGGPGNASRVLQLYIYEQAFARGHFGYASAMSVVLFLILAGAAFAQMRLLRAGESDLS
jgi:multiple sugar transport system permease protein